MARSRYILALLTFVALGMIIGSSLLCFSILDTPDFRLLILVVSDFLLLNFASGVIELDLILTSLVESDLIQVFVSGVIIRTAV